MRGLKLGDHSYAQVLSQCNSFLLTRFWQFSWKINSVTDNFCAVFLAKMFLYRSSDIQDTEDLILSDKS